MGETRTSTNRQGRMGETRTSTNIVLGGFMAVSGCHAKRQDRLGVVHRCHM